MKTLPPIRAICRGSSVCRGRIWHRARRAFTLLEVMIVIALIGVAMTLLFASAGSLFPDTRKDSPYETLRKAVDAAWYAAAIGHEQYVLEYDADAKTLYVRPIADERASTPDAENDETSGDSAGADATANATAGANTAANADNARAASSAFGPPPRVQRFAFDSAIVDSLLFARPPDTGQGSLSHTSTLPFPCLYFSPWGGTTPAILELTVQGRLHSYRLDPFGGALIEQK